MKTETGSLVSFVSQPNHPLFLPMKKPQNLRSSFSRTLSLLSVVLLLVSCGSMEKSMKKGDAAWALGEYAEAAAQYKSAYTRCRQKDKKVRAHVAYKMGTAYRRYGNVARAVGAFRTAQRFGAEDSLTLFYLGEMLQKQGSYKAAAEAFEEFLNQNPKNKSTLR